MAIRCILCLKTQLFYVKVERASAPDNFVVVKHKLIKAFNPVDYNDKAGRMIKISDLSSQTSVFCFQNVHFVALA